MDQQHSIRKRSLYRAVWRWHFIAGLLVLPFLLLLAITGGLYLFKDELDHLVYRAWEDLPVRSGAQQLPATVLIARAENATGGSVLQLMQPEDDSQSIRMIVRMPDGEPRTAFVDPYDGRVLGTTRFGGVMQIVRKLHSLQYFGPRASWLVEIAAGWAIVLVGTGIYLWWPRGRSGGVVSVRGTPRHRTFWRDTHAVTGAFTGVVLLFLAITGMPWSDVWGGKVQQLATATATGRPDPPAEVVPDWQLENHTPPRSETNATHHHDQVKTPLPWALEKAVAPQSDAVGGRQPLDVDRAVEALAHAKLPRPYSVTLPQGPRGAYVGSYTPARVEDTRIVYVDQYDASVLDDVGFDRFGATAKAIEWGIAVHQGQEYGSVNRYLMLAGCLAIVILSISSVTMWWKRRPRGALGLPPAPSDPRVFRGLIAIIIPVGIFYPLVGVSFVIALAVDGAFHVIARSRQRID